MTTDSSSFPSASSSVSSAAAKERRWATLAHLCSVASDPVENFTARFYSIDIASRKGGDSQAPVLLTSGESVFVFHESIDVASNTTLCGVAFGNQGKLCFCTGCAIQAPRQNQEDSRLLFGCWNLC